MPIIPSRSSNCFHLLATLPVTWSFNQYFQKGFKVDDRKIASLKYQISQRAGFQHWWNEQSHLGAKQSWQLQ